MKKLVVFAVVLLCMTGVAWADVVTINEGVYTGRYTNSGNDVIINNGQFNSFSPNFHAWPFENVTGTVVINRGQFNGAAFDSYGYGFLNRGAVTINGGEFNGIASANYGFGFCNDGKATINGGRFSGTVSNSYARGFQNYGVVTVNGGEFIGTASAYYGYGFCNDAIAIIRGGKFIGTASSRFNSGLYNSGTMTIYGTFTQYGELRLGSGSFSGTLANGVYETITYTNYGSIYLVPVPEPSSILTLLCGIGGMGGMIWRRKSA